MNNTRSIHPPRWPVKFLRFLLKEKYLEEIEGDMEEIFYENAAQFSVGKAKRKYAWEMIKLLRPNLIRNLEFFNYLNQYGMFKNYFKVSLRGLMKYPLNSFINLFGLAAAISFCIFAYAFARWTYNRDQFHENKDVVFLTTFYASREGALQQYGNAPRPLAEVLKEDFPQIEKTCRVEHRNVVVKYFDQTFHETVRFTDPSFLEMFTFPLKWGTTSTLSDVNSVIISEAISAKYFGDENPIGQSLQIKFGSDKMKEFKVTGVAAKFPTSRSFDFTFLINLENIRTLEPAYNTHDWASFADATFIQVYDPQDIRTIQSQMVKYKKLQNEAVKEDWAIDSFGFESLGSIHLKTDHIRDDVFRGGYSSNISSIGFLTVVCVLMLALACFNYINIAIVTAVKRLKELGVRKTIGATRKMIIVQFLAENILITFFALAMGLALAWLFVIPWFENLWNFSMNFSFTDPKLWIYLPVILLVTGAISGIYPSLYISRFQTVKILKGSVKFGHKNPVTKVFLGLQLVLACVFITSAVMFSQNTTYMAQRSWGYSNRDVLYAVTPDELSFEQLRTRMSQNPKVLSQAASQHHIGKDHRSVLLHFPDKDVEADMLAVDAGYLETMGITVKEGRTLHDAPGGDMQSIIVNETMVKNLGWLNPIGQQFKMDSLTYEVVGVVQDFHSYSFFTPLRSAFFTMTGKNNFRYLSIKVSEGAELETFESLKKTWAQLFPEVPFSGGFQEDVWGNYYEEMNIHGHVWRVFASVAVILATLGLYGLVKLNVSGRVREFSIRKILGANLNEIALMIFNQYNLLFAAALLIGVPLSYYGIKAVLDFAYPYHMPVTFWSIMLAAFLLVIVLVGTVSTQVLKVFKSNPVHGLKVE